MPNILELKRAREEMIKKMDFLLNKSEGTEEDGHEFDRLKGMVEAHDQKIEEHENRMKCLEKLCAKDVDEGASEEEMSMDEVEDKGKGGGKDMGEDPDMESMRYNTGIRKMKAVPSYIPGAHERIQRHDRTERNNDDLFRDAYTFEDVSYLTKSGYSKMVIKQPKRKGVPLGTNFACYVIASGLERKYGRGAGLHWLNYNHKEYDPDIAKALNSAAQSMGGFAVPQEFVAELVPVLRSEVLLRKIGPRVYPMATGNITMPRQNSSINGYWIGETSYANATQLTGDNIQFSAHKLMAVTAATNDLIRRSALVAEAFIRDDLVEQIARLEDSAYLLNTTYVGAGQGAPLGLLGQVANATNLYQGTANTAVSYTSLNTTNTTTWLANTAGILQSMELSLKTQNVKTKGCHWLLNPVVPAFLKTVTDQVGNFVYRPELNEGKLWGYPYEESNIIPSNLGAGGNCSLAFFVQPDEVMIGDALNVAVDSTSEGAYQSGGTLVSTFSNDQTAFRVIKESDLQLRHPTGVAIAYLPGWAPQGYNTFANGVTYSTQTADTQPSAAQSSYPTG